MKVMIGIPTAETGRRADFYDYVNMLEKPEGTAFISLHGQSPARSRNLMVEEAKRYEFTHILFLDDDMAFKPDTLNRLLVHDVDIVSSFYLMRAFPHQPVIFSKIDDNGRALWYYPEDNEGGLIPVAACGLGCLLIKMEVFRKMSLPWFTLGELERDHWCDDISFCKRAGESGFKIFCDLSVKLGHFSSTTVWPNKIDGVWNITYDFFGKGQLNFPQIKRP